MEIINPRMRSSFYLPVRPLEQNTSSVMAAAFENLEQSQDELELFAHAMDVRLFALWPRLVERGGACSVHFFTLSKIKTLVSVSNVLDSFCLLRSICIGMMDVERREERVTQAEYEQFINSNEQLEKALADMLQCFDGTVIDEQQPDEYDLRDVRAVQDFFNTHMPGVYRLVVLQHTREHGTQLVWKSNVPAKHDICLYWEHRHWAFIGEPRHLFPECSYFCVDCGARLKRSFKLNARPCVGDACGRAMAFPANCRWTTRSPLSFSAPTAGSPSQTPTATPITSSTVERATRQRQSARQSE